MVQTFYKSKPAEGDPQAEYYSLELRSLQVGFAVLEFHGWWDDSAKKPRLNFWLLNTSDEPLPDGEAQRIYESQKANITAQGFDQQFETDYEGIRGPVGGSIHTDLSKKN
jgi:hypothetical protein